MKAAPVTRTRRVQRPLRVELVLAPVPMPLAEVEAWIDRYLEYILGEMDPLLLQSSDDAA